MDQIEEIKKRLNIVDVISGYIPLKRAGRNYSGLCPFHAEKTPSFMVNPDKQIWYCFGCNKGGDVISFVQDFERLDFRQALEILAEQAGVQLESINYLKKDHKDLMIDINDIVASYYSKVLFSDRGEKALSYFKDQRGLREDIIKKFRLGYAPIPPDFLSKVAAKAQLNVKAMTELGLVIPSKNGYIDRFRQRLIFPLADATSRVVGFAGRVFDSDRKDIAKYLNSPNSDIYNKSFFIYGLCFAKEKIKSDDFVVIVEGNMDVISCHQAGFENTVCSSGTALAQEQIAILKRYSKNIYLAFDQDEAGLKAAERALSLAGDEDLNIKVVVSDQGKDPDEIIKKNPEFWQQALDEAMHPIEYIWSLGSKQYGKVLSSQSKKELAKKISGYILRITNPVERDDWINKTAKYLGVSEQAMRDQIGQLMPSGQAAPLLVKKEEAKPLKTIIEQSILATIFAEPFLIAEAIELISPDDFFDQDCKEIYKKLDFYYTNKDVFDYQVFRSMLDIGIISLADRLAILRNFTGREEAHEELKALFKRYTEEKLKVQRERLKDQIDLAEKKGNIDLKRKLINDYQGMNKEKYGR